MAKFKTLSEELLSEVLELPIGDRVWVIASPPAEQGIRVSRLMAGAMNVHNDLKPTAEQTAALRFNDYEEQQLMIDLLGEESFTEMSKLYNWAVLQHILMTVMVWVAFNAEGAEKYWSADPNFEPNRSQRRQKKKSARPA